MTTLAAQPAGPTGPDRVALTITATPERVVIGDPWPVTATLRNGEDSSWPAPSEEEPWGIVFALTREGETQLGAGARERRRRLSRSASPPPPSPGLRAGGERVYALDLSEILLARPKPGRWTLSVSHRDHGINLQGGSVAVELVAPAAVAGDMIFDSLGARPVGLFLRRDLGPDPVVAAAAGPRTRPDLAVMRPAAALAPDAAPRLFLPAPFGRTPPAFALALEDGGAAYLAPAAAAPDGAAPAARLPHRTDRLVYSLFTTNSRCPSCTNRSMPSVLSPKARA